MAKAPRKVTIGVVPFEQMKDHSLELLRAGQRAADAGQPFPGAYIGFATHELLWKTLPPKRMALLNILAGHEPMSIREAARQAGRDVKAVHGDVQVLLRNGVLKKDTDGRIVFPYDEIHLNVVLKPVADRAA